MDKLSFWDMTTGGQNSATNKYLVTEAIMCPFLDQNDPKATGRIQRKMSIECVLRFDPVEDAFIWDERH